MEVTTTREMMNQPCSPRGQIGNALDGPAHSAEYGPDQHTYAHQHDEALHGLGVEHAAQAAHKHGKAHQQGHQPDQRPDRQRKNLRQQQSRALDHRRSIDPQKYRKEQGQGLAQKGAFMPLGQQLCRRAGLKVALTAPGGPGQKTIDDPGSQPDIAGCHQKHLQPVDISQTAEAHQGHG